MILALDTNVIQALLERNHMFQTRAYEILKAHQDKVLVMSPFVYAASYGIPNFDEAVFFTLLTEAQIRIDMDLSDSLWRRAGIAQVGYHQRRKRHGQNEPKRLLADFLIGAHALSIGASLMTFDPKGYRVSFPDLELLP